jgi:CRISPR/Cas system Type II protein with McrA/HNH and RuvC-like nuclease domain
MQDGKCFYDEGHDMALPEVDHALPWSFVLEDRTWNLVLACRKCNNEKRDRLTDMDALERLCIRNEEIAQRLFFRDRTFAMIGRHDDGKLRPTRFEFTRS